MRIVRESSLEEYAGHFWVRQERKKDPRDSEALADIGQGGDPVWWLGKCYPSKLPRPENDFVRLALLDRDDLETLRLPSYALDDRWMQCQDLVPVPRTTRMVDLAARARERGFFAETRSHLRGSQHRYYDAWKKLGSLKAALDGRDLPIVQRARPNEYEVVDGWGRFLPFIALLQEGFSFEAVTTFVADRD